MKLDRFAFIAGDGIGPDTAWGARRCVEALCAEIGWEEVSLGQREFARRGNPFPASAGKLLAKAGAVLKGPLEGSYPGLSINPNNALKRLLGVYAGVRRFEPLACASTVPEGPDIMLIKQEDFGWPGNFELSPDDGVWPALLRSSNGGPDETGGYAVSGGESLPRRGAASVRYVDPEKARRFFEFAFKYARERGRRSVTLAHRANMYRKSDGAWLKAADEVSRRFEGLDFEDQLVDHVALQMARSPERFDVIVTDEPYGDILGDMGAGLAGGLGMAGQAFFGESVPLFTSVHGTAPRYAGQDRANPCAMMLAAAEMLIFSGRGQAGGQIRLAVREMLREGRRTADLCRDGEQPLGTREFIQEAVKRLGRGSLAKETGGTPPRARSARGNRV